MAVDPCYQNSRELSNGIHCLGSGRLKVTVQLIGWTTLQILFVLNRNFSGGEEVVVTIKTQGCRGQENEINYLEHVQVFVNISHNHRGNLAIYLKSPQSKLLEISPSTSNLHKVSHWKSCHLPQISTK